MYDNDSKGVSYLAGFFMLIAFLIGSMFIAAAIAGPIWSSMTGQSIDNIEEGLKNPAYINANRVAHAIQFLIGFLLPTILVARMLNRKPAKLLGFTGSINTQQIALVIGIMFISLLVGAGFAYINEHIPLPESWKIKAFNAELNYNSQISAIAGLNNFSDYIISLLVLALLPALCEEALFRGGLQNFLTKHTAKPWLAIIIVSIIFSAAHFSFYGFLTRLFLGIVLGAVYYYSGRLWLAILAHFLNNALAITVMYTMMQNGKTIAQAAAESNSNWWGLAFAPILLGLFTLLKKHSPAPQTEAP